MEESIFVFSSLIEYSEEEANMSRPVSPLAEVKVA
jgi:hypothetical protein